MSRSGFEGTSEYERTQVLKDNFGVGWFRQGQVAQACIGRSCKQACSVRSKDVLNIIIHNLLEELLFPRADHGPYG
jgi:hypothetical protein